MIVSIMCMLDNGELFSMAKDTFDEKTGYDRRSLFKLYKQCRAELLIKIRRADELKQTEAKDGQKTD